MLIAIVAVFTLGFVTALIIAEHVERRAVIRAQAATSAATTIIVFLLILILALILAAVGAVVGWHWLQAHQKREKMRKALTQAQIYALLSGARMPAPRRPATPATPTRADGNIIILPGGGQPPVTQFTIENTGRRPDPWAGLLPPDAGGDWQW